jgi:excisionase family DNA binding protein
MPQGGSNKLLSIPQTAEKLNQKERTVREYWRKWGLRGYRVGRTIQFRERDIEAWIEQNAA